MYPSIFYTLKRLIFRYLLKIANISAKIVLESRKIAVPLHLGNGNETENEKLFDNIESEKADRDGYRF